MSQLIESLKSPKIEVRYFDVITSIPDSIEDGTMSDYNFHEVILVINDCLEVTYSGHIVNRMEFRESLFVSIEKKLIEINSAEEFLRYEKSLVDSYPFISIECAEFLFDKNLTWTSKKLGDAEDLINYKYLGHETGANSFVNEIANHSKKWNYRLSRGVKLILDEYLTGSLYAVIKEGVFKSEYFRFNEIRSRKEDAGNNSLPLFQAATIQSEQSDKFCLNNVKQQPLDDLYDFLKNRKGLISNETSKADFKSIFGLNNREVVIDWVGSLSLLNCFLRNLPSIFKASENFNHFVVGAKCFVYKGQVITADQIRNNRYIKNSQQAQGMISFLESLVV